MRFKTKAEAVAYIEGIKQGYHDAKNEVDKMGDDFARYACPEMFVEKTIID